MTSSTRLAPRPWEWASQSRWLRALRLGCRAAASSSAPTWLSGCRSVRYGWPPTSAVPSSAASRPRITRIVVDLPAPFGPTKPVTWPGRTVNVIPSSACTAPNRLRSPATSMVASMLDQARFRRDGGRHAGEPSCASSFRVTFPGCPSYGGWPGFPVQGDAIGLGCGDNDCMATGWTQRIAAAPHSLTTVGVVLGLAAVGQAIARAVMLATAHAVQAAPVGTAARRPCTPCRCACSPWRPRFR